MTPDAKQLTAHLRALALAANPTGGLSDGELVRRYASTRDEAAFEVLVWRHGPMVWATCRRVLRHHQDAEDAFQATFLALARHATAGGPRRSVAGWLHRVAFNAALKLKEKRRPTEVVDEAPAAPQPVGTELGQVVDEELERLPDHYRVVFVLCCLEGMTNTEAARELGCAVGTVNSRLHAARIRLRDRLTRRGFAPGILATVGATVAVPSAVSAGAIALGRKATIPLPSIDRLANEVGRTMIAGTRIATVAALFGLGITVAAVWAFATAAAPPAEPTPPAPPAASAPPAEPPDSPARVAHIGSPEFRHPKYVSLLGTSTDGKWLYTAEAAPLNHGGEVFLYVWDTATGKLQTRHDLGGGAKVIQAIGFGPDGVRVFERDMSWQSRVRIVNPDTGKTVKTGEFWAPKPQKITSFSTFEWYNFSTDAAWVISATPEGYRLVNTTTGAETLIDLGKRGKSAGSSESAYGFTRDGRLFYAQPETVVRLHELPSGKHLGDIADAGNEQQPAGFTPDGKHLLLWVRSAQVWSLDAYEIATKKRRTILDKRAQSGRVFFASDGKQFALVPMFGSYPASDWEVREFATGKELGRVPASGYPHGVLFSPDGRTLFTRPSENMVVPWDVATGRPTAGAPALLGPIERFRFTPDGKFVGLAGGFVYMWDAQMKELARVRVPRPIDGYGAVTFNPTADRLHFTAVSEKLVAWDFRTGTIRESAFELKRLENSAIEHWYTPDGSRHVEHRYSDALLILRDPATAKETARVSIPVAWRHQGGTTVVMGLALSPDGQRLAVGGDNTHDRPDPSGKLPPSRVGVVSVAGSEKVVTGEAAGRVSALAFAPAGRFLVATLRESPVPELGVWHSHTGRRIATIRLERSPIPADALTPTRVNAVRFSPDGRTLAVSLGEHEVRLIETVTWRVRATVMPRTHESNIYFGTDRSRDVIAWAPDGRRLAIATVAGGLAVWDVRKHGTAKPPDDALDPMWAALAGDDAPAAFTAIRALAETPDRAVPLLKSKVAPVPAPDAAKLKAVLAGLGSEEFAERERATTDLAKLGQLAEPALRATLRTTSSAEVTQRIGGLLDRLAAAKVTADELVAARVVEVAEWINTPEAVKLLETWAGGAEGARLTTDALAALKRLGKR